MYKTGCSGLVHWDDPEGWDEKGCGRGVQGGDTGTLMADSCQCMAKPLHFCKVINSPPPKKKQQLEQEGINGEDENKDTMILT